MSPAPTSESPGPLRTFAFGAPGQDTWLAGWFPDPSRAGVVLVSSAAGTEARAAQLTAGDAGGDWQLSAEGVALSLSPTSEPAVVSGLEGEAPGFEQTAQASGSIDGEQCTLPGRRGEQPSPGDTGQLDSVREIAAWFDGVSIALSAVRPRKHKGHEQDAMRAGVVDPDGASPIVDPRLSTTYTAQGRIRRVGLELWPADEEQPPMRLVAEALGHGAVVSSPGWEITVDWLAAHRRGHDGLGVYLLARPT